MTRDELLTGLLNLADAKDPEWAHAQADDLLLAYIDDDEISAAFDAVPKWYA